MKAGACFAAIVAWSIACSASGGEGGNRSNATADGGVPADGGIADACRASRRGVIELTLSSPEAPVQSSVFVRFEQTLLTQASPRCSTETSGACEVKRCTPGAVSDPADGPVCPAGWPSAGTVTVAGGATTALTITPDASGGYLSHTEPGSRWSGGDELSVGTTGGVVPAFSTKIAFPSPVVLSPSDPLLGTDPVTVPQSQAFTISWSPGVGRIELVLEESGNTTELVTLKCRFPSAAGRGAIPTAALAKLSVPAPGAISGSLRLRSMDENDVRAGDFAVRVTAQALLPNRTYKIVP